MSTITPAQATINTVTIARHIVQCAHHFNVIVSHICDYDNMEYKPMWMHVDMDSKSIKCTCGMTGKERVMGFYPMTKAGIRQAYHDIRLCAWYAKKS